MDELYLDVITLLEKGENLEKAHQLLATLREHECDTQRVVVLEAALLEREGRLQDSQERLQRFIAANLDCGVARSNLARLQWKGGERARAIGTLRFGLMKDPNQERSLHLLAAWLEEESDLPGALSSLRVLAQNPGAWLPAWVACQLASTRAPLDAGDFLVLSARQAQIPFPPNVTTLVELVGSLPDSRTVAAAIRPYCRADAQAALDALLSEPPAVGPASASELKVTCLRRSVWRHLSQPQPCSALGLCPIVLIKPESWGVEQVAGRLARGLALLMAESLDALTGGSVAVILETVPPGVITRDKPVAGADLARLAGSSCKQLLSAYLSFRPPSEFILDAEIYSSKGEYLTRESCRADHPGACIGQLAQRLSTNLVSADSSPYPPTPDLEIDDALARETVASLILCAEGALSPSALANSGQLLDALVQYALQSESSSSLLTLWAGVEATARAGLPGGEAQREMLAQILSGNADLVAWIGPN